MPVGDQKKLTSRESRRSWQELSPDSADNLQPLIRQRQVVYKTPHQSIYRVIADFGDFTKEYFVNEYGPRAGLVVDCHGEILLVRQYRLLIDRMSWEVPGGAVDEGETPEQAAVRECLEETGVRCLNPQPLVFYHMALDIQYNPTYLFYSNEVADELEPQRINTREVRGWEWIPLNRCIEMIFEQQIVDSFSIVALLSYQNLISKR